MVAPAKGEQEAPRPWAMKNMVDPSPTSTTPAGVPEGTREIMCTLGTNKAEWHLAKQAAQKHAVWSLKPTLPL